MKNIYTLILTFIFYTPLSAENNFCGVRNTTFLHGEKTSYTVFYSVAGIYVNAGTVNFDLSLKYLDNTPVYHSVSTGTSNTSYDWIFRVRDRYESFFDTTNLRPLKFIRNVDEGGFKIYENVTFNQQKNTASTVDGIFNTPNCVQDVLSAIYYMRNINFDKYKVDDKIPVDVFLDNKTYSLTVRYVGREIVKTKYGKFRTIKIKPLLIKGEMFKDDDKMTIWVSDDSNRIPVRIESPIVVGSVKVDLMQYRNLRYPLSSLVSWK